MLQTNESQINKGEKSRSINIKLKSWSNWYAINAALLPRNRQKQMQLRRGVFTYARQHCEISYGKWWDFTEFNAPPDTVYR